MTTSFRVDDFQCFHRRVQHAARMIFVLILSVIILLDVLTALQNGDFQAVLAKLLVPPFLYHRSMFAIMCLMLCKI